MSTITATDRHRRPAILAVLSLLFVLGIPQAPSPETALAQAQATCGAWTVVPTAGTPLEIGRFDGVAATSAKNVWVIGDTAGMSDLLARWDGRRWSVEAHPQPGSYFNDFQAIDASAEGDAWIVGAFSSSQASRPSMAETSTLTQRLQGGRWKLIPSPNSTQSAQPYLTGVAAIGPDDVWAVGGGSGQDILMRWNGFEWGIVPGPPTEQGGYLFDVAGSAPGDVWAVGVRTTDDFTQAARVLHWDGTSWQQVAAPAIVSHEYSLQGVAALTASDVWAVGSRKENDRTRTLIEHWDGNAWSIVPSPNGSLAESTLSTVAAAAPDDVWAVGRTSIADQARPLVLHWDGSSWSSVNLPNLRARFADLTSVATVPGSGEIWAVGVTAEPDSVERTLAMRYLPCDGAGHPSPVVPGMPRTGAIGTMSPAVLEVRSAVESAVSNLLRIVRKTGSS